MLKATTTVPLVNQEEEGGCLIKEKESRVVEIVEPVIRITRNAIEYTSNVCDQIMLSLTPNTEDNMHVVAAFLRLKTTPNSHEFLWHYALSSLWPNMTKDEVHRFLEQLYLCNEALLIECECLHLLPASQHPINRLSVVKKLLDYSSFLGILEPRRSVIITRLKRIRDSVQFQPRKERSVWATSKLWRDEMIPYGYLNLDDFKKSNTSNNLQYTICIEGITTMEEEGEFIQEYRKVKTKNLYSLLFASKIITATMSMKERCLILSYVAGFDQRQVRALIEFDCLKYLPEKRTALRSLHLINFLAYSDKEIYSPLFDLGEETSPSENVLALYLGYLDGYCNFELNPNFSLQSQQYMVGFHLTKYFKNQLPFTEIVQHYEKLELQHETLKEFISSRIVEATQKCQAVIEQKLFYVPWINYGNAARLAREKIQQDAKNAGIEASGTRMQATSTIQEMFINPLMAFGGPKDRVDGVSEDKKRI